MTQHAAGAHWQINPDLLFVCRLVLSGESDTTWTDLVVVRSAPWGFGMPDISQRGTRRKRERESALANNAARIQTANEWNPCGSLDFVQYKCSNSAFSWSQNRGMRRRTVWIVRLLQHTLDNPPQLCLLGEGGMLYSKLHAPFFKTFDKRIPKNCTTFGKNMIVVVSYFFRRLVLFLAASFSTYLWHFSTLIFFDIFIAFPMFLSVFPAFFIFLRYFLKHF